MRTFLGVVLLVLGLPVLVAGTVAAVYTGPDDTFGVVDEEISTDAAVLVSAPSVLDVAGPTLHVAADVDGADTFVGVAHPVHLGSYLDGVQVEQITQAGWREDLTHEAVSGEETAPVAPPGGLDWWQASSTGSGEQRVSVELTAEPAQVVVSAADPQAPLAADLAVEAEIEGVFATALLVVGLGLLLTAAGIMLLFTGRRRRRAGRRRVGTGNLPDPAQADAGDPETAGPPPPPERPSGSARLQRATTVGAGAALLLAGCAELPEEVEHTAEPATVAVTERAADRFFAHYTETNNTANTEQDADLIATVESGPLLRSSQMAYQVQQAQERDPIPAFTVDPQYIAAPRFDAYPMWFVALIEPESDGAGPAYYLVNREDATSSWQAQLSVYAPDDAEPIRPTVTDGAAMIAGDDQAARGQEALDAIVEYAETGEEPEGIDLSAQGGLGSLPEQGIEITEGPENRVTVDRSCALADVAVRWLETEAGAMGMTAVTCTQSVTLDEGYTITLDGSGYGTIPGGVHLSEMTITHGVSIVVAVNDDGTASVSGEAMLPYSMDYVEEESQ
ncbi:hypothetical protein [Phytoactinopolyspora halotolerans]|uniref:DUF8094 domain-containing protein n=1 Tax=Phytoactinopolyspora halotolerans TaxID=1981512 RepID=A0A6L9SBS3_9ACTN|nr:hypothetical protein [Phytoactinopolyspora halotolerans]NEE02805.1 hypothetical protein [Phytoactinopolyspora halotolerans]